jgi:hypothetical protein
LISRIFIAFKRVDRFLVLALLVQRLALGAIFLDLVGLRRGELGVLRHCIVDLLHVRGAMERKRGAGSEQRRNKQRGLADHHGTSLVH